jgi:hypothetical protein
MSPEFLADVVIHLGILSLFLLILGVGGLIADYALPRIPFVQNWIDSLPDYEDEEDEIREYEAEHRRRSQKSRKGF